MTTLLQPESMVASAVASLPAASLAEVTERAALQTRTDAKYLVPVECFPDLVARLSSRFSALEIGDSRAFAYESVYFDTPDLLSYHQHLQGRRRRYKVRTRAYLDSADCTFEVKLKGHRGETVKERAPHPLAERASLTPQARTFLADLLRERYDLATPPLAPTVTTAYRRTTLVDLDEGTRVTCDVDLVCRGAGRVTGGPQGHVLVETKAQSSGGLADRALHRLGLRPVPMSKYCIAVALVYPGVRANPWRRTLRRYFGQSARPQR